MKKLFSLIALMLAALTLLAACAGGGSGGDDYKSLLVTKDTLTIGTSPDYPPYESLENGQLVGFDIELMEAVGEIMGLTIEWKQMDFDNILLVVPTGQVDIGVSAFTYNPDRTSVLFNNVSYLESAQVAFVKADSDIQSPEDFAGRKFYAGLGTTGEMALNDIADEFGALEILTSMDYQVAFTMLDMDQLDGVVCDRAVGEGYIETMGLRAIEPALIEEENLIITAKGNEALVEALDAAFTEFMQTQEYKDLRAKYGF